MEEFNALVAIIKRLLGPGGCPWDQKQTLQSMRSSLVEETFEVIEAIDLNDPHHIEEELGDLFFNVVFFCALAEKENLFLLADVLKHISAKLMRRHPHVFGDSNANTYDDVLKLWQEVKSVEKKNKPLKSAVDNIPKGLPSLSRAQRLLKKFKETNFKIDEKDVADSEDRAGAELWHLVEKISNAGLEADEALRKRLAHLEASFRAWEQSAENEL